MKKIEFTADHVGLKVTHAELGRGEITCFSKEFGFQDAPVRAIFGGSPEVFYFSEDGKAIGGSERVLFIGHNVKFKMVEEGELPEPKTVCPVCGVEHEVVRNLHCTRYSFIVPERSHPTEVIQRQCPFRDATFETKELAEKAMANLIKFCEPPTEEITIERRPSPYHDRMVEFWDQKCAGGRLVPPGDE